jgi:hypothetical protein
LEVCFDRQCKIKDREVEIRKILEEAKTLATEVDHSKQVQCPPITQNSKIKKPTGTQKRIFNSCHADGPTPDGSMFSVIQLKLNSSALPTELTLSVSKKMVNKAARDMT